MPRYLLVALNGPTEAPDDEAAYNRWYDEIHIPDLLAIRGVTAARRYKVERSNRAPWRYVAAYEIETEDLDGFMKALETEPRPFTPTLDRTRSAFVLARELEPGA